MKKLLKAYDFTSELEYFEMIDTSIINGQRAQARAQFKEMPKSARLEYFNCVCNGNQSVNASEISYFFE